MSCNPLPIQYAGDNDDLDLEADNASKEVNLFEWYSADYSPRPKAGALRRFSVMMGR